MRWLFVVGFACAALVAAQQQSLDRAWDLASKGQRTEAIRLLQELVKTEPGNADVHLLLGSLLMEEGQREVCIEQLTAGVKLAPRSAQAQNALGEAYHKFGDTAAARTAFEKAVALEPNFGIGQLNLGQTLLTAGDVEAGAQHLDRAIRLLGRTDEAADAHYLRAKIYTAKGDAAAASAQLSQAVTIRPSFAEAWSDLGQARRTTLDDAGALAAFERAVTSNPQDAVAQYRLGAEYLRQKKTAPAIEHLQRAYQINPSDQSTMNALQMAFRQAGRLQEADEVKRRLADLLHEKDKSNQNHLTAVRLNNEGADWEKKGDLTAALAKYREAAQLYPEHVGIHVNYAVALLRLGQWTTGLDEMHSALQLDPGNERIKTALKDALAQAPRNAIPAWAGEIR
jgi:tetratricopeptide (TPR) repeat protein